MPHIGQVHRRWRPSIGMVVSGVCIVLISVPLLALLAVRLTSNQFVRETEQSLIQQGAIYAELYSDAFGALPGDVIGIALNEERQAHWNADLHPARAILNVRVDDVLPPRPHGSPVQGTVDPRHEKIIDGLVNIARLSQQTTLSGVTFLTHEGRLLNEARAPSLAELPEIQTALGGDIGSALRQRGDSYQVHPLATISRDTGYRVFVAYPVIVQNGVIGVVYLSRTPLNIGKFLYQERSAILTMLGVMVLAACGIGWVLTRLITRPVKGLRDEAIAVAEGRMEHAAALPHYGFRELATLGECVGAMAKSLTDKSREITPFTDHVTHELKSPVTTISGAAELLQTNDLSQKDRAKLLQNIAQEGQRMNALLGRLREITRLRTMAAGEAGELSDMIPQMDGLDIQTEITENAKLPLTLDHGRIILLHMAQNAQAHDATTLRIIWDGKGLTLIDNGSGIAAGDIAHLTEPFFTTRRDTGGTGMGLAICETILNGYGATLCAEAGTDGAVFIIRSA